MKLYTREQMIQAFDYGKTLKGFDWIGDMIDSLEAIELPSDEEIWRWWKTQKFQKEQGEQEYKMLYEIDLAKILKAFIEHFIKTEGNDKK